MTPPETPESRSTEPETSAEQSTSVISVSDGGTAAGQQAGAEAEAEQESAGDTDQAQADSGTNQETNHTVTDASNVPDDSTADEIPPWQRMTSDADSDATAPTKQEQAAAWQAPQNTQIPADAGNAGNAVRQVSVDTQARAPAGAPQQDLSNDDTVTVRRPVLTGASAQSVYQQTVGFAGQGPAPDVDGPQRTAVHLGTQQSAAGNQRPIGVAPPSALRRPGRGPRRASLQIKRLDPWSVLKLSLVLGVALFFVWLVAVGVLYTVLEGMGVWDKLNGTYNELLQGGIDTGSTEQLVSAGRVFGVAAIIGAVNIVLFSALATIGAFVYNVSADLAGGLEVTLAERE